CDFLAYSPRVRQFYRRPPSFANWFADEVSRIQYDSQRRECVSDILARQNKNWRASSRTLENIARLRAGASAVLTGQQVGLFGGLVFSIYKAMTAVKLANEATAGGVDSVPIFWLATEDHDLAEINHVAVPGPNHVPQRLETSTHGLPNAPVGSLSFGPEIGPVLAPAAEL